MLESRGDSASAEAMRREAKELSQTGSTISLNQACADGDIELVKSLIRKGADINERGGWGDDRTFQSGGGGGTGCRCTWQLVMATRIYVRYLS